MEILHLDQYHGYGEHSDINSLRIVCASDHCSLEKCINMNQANPLRVNARHNAYVAYAPARLVTWTSTLTSPDPLVEDTKLKT
jgi:hypothetical protein